jgi:hypothetical protein
LSLFSPLVNAVGRGALDRRKASLRPLTQGNRRLLRAMHEPASLFTHLPARLFRLRFASHLRLLHLVSILNQAFVYFFACSPATVWARHLACQAKRTGLTELLEANVKPKRRDSPLSNPPAGATQTDWKRPDQIASAPIKKKILASCNGNASFSHNRRPR